jgi:signal transduction histidine kinase
LRFFKGGIYVLLYNEQKELIDGQAPIGFASTESLKNKDMRSVTVNGEKFYLYDRLIEFNKQDDIWIRGITTATGPANAIDTIVQLAFITLPFFVLLAGVGGYLIAKRSFKPLEKITRAANAINEGKDLSKRISLGKGRDEIYQLAEILNNMIARLESSFESEKQFTSDASHELRTPTAVILAECEYASNNAVTPEEYKEALEVINRQASKMKKLISQLLSFSRMEQGTEKVCFEHTDLSELVQMIISEQSEIHRDSDIVLSSNLQPGIMVRVDRLLITRMILNLINNAFQYGRSKGFVQVSLKSGQESIELSVKDNGTGIAIEDQSRVWQRFYQVSESRTSKEEGSMGLGLAMVKQIVEIHSGTVRVESVLGEGSNFIVRLPIQK